MDSSYQDMKNDKISDNTKHIIKWYGKYGKKLWNDMENMEERQVE
jgi:hypothetical protein